MWVLSASMEPTIPPDSLWGTGTMNQRCGLNAPEITLTAHIGFVTAPPLSHPTLQNQQTNKIMINRMNNEDGSISGPCPLCSNSKEETVALKIQLELCRAMLKDQIELLKDVTRAADATNTYLEEFGFSDEE